MTKNGRRQRARAGWWGVGGGGGGSVVGMGEVRDRGGGGGEEGGRLKPERDISFSSETFVCQQFGLRSSLTDTALEETKLLSQETP